LSQFKINKNTINYIIKNIYFYLAKFLWYEKDKIIKDDNEKIDDFNENNDNKSHQSIFIELLKNGYLILKDCPFMNINTLNNLPLIYLEGSATLE